MTNVFTFPRPTGIIQNAILQCFTAIVSDCVEFYVRSTHSSRMVAPDNHALAKK